MKSPVVFSSAYRGKSRRCRELQKKKNGQALCSVELVTILTKPRRNNGGTTNLIARGLEDVGRRLRPDFRITQGRDLKTGVNEAFTSQRMAERFENLACDDRKIGDRKI